MNKLTIITLILGFLFANKINYWNLGVSINSSTTTPKKIIQKEIDLNAIIIEEKNAHKINVLEPAIYTLKTNYLIEPQSVDIHQLADIENRKENRNIKHLILNEEYFESAKQILKLTESEIMNEFNDRNDFYYWYSFIYYNLGNQEEAYEKIQKISNRESFPQILFLEALILKEIKPEESILLLKKIIQEFPHDDYKSYAQNLLLEN